MTRVNFTKLATQNNTRNHLSERVTQHLGPVELSDSQYKPSQLRASENKTVVQETNSMYASEMTLEQHEDYFKDPVEKFVQTLKHVTQAAEINIYTEGLIQIYKDVEAIVYHP